MNPSDLLVPSAARALPAGSKERALARLYLRQVWHVVFDPCPGLVAAFPPDGTALLDAFLEHAAGQRLSMRWSLHGQLLFWL
ncbi:MAG: hypothetical protein HY077_05825, partial [Elusimicrobia bacterium]|nr:hypothetical protein [Elusimicrobiota bacterium]